MLLRLQDRTLMELLVSNNPHFQILGYQLLSQHYSRILAIINDNPYEIYEIEKFKNAVITAEMDIVF
jgi:hypothetical protein